MGVSTKRRTPARTPTPALPSPKCSLKIVWKGTKEFPRAAAAARASFAANCKGFVRALWGKPRVGGSDAIVLCLPPGGSEETVSTRSGHALTSQLWGFGLIRLPEGKGKSKEAYLDVLCSAHRQGKRILSFIETSLATTGRRLITLRALPHVVEYYKKLGYARREDACAGSKRFKPIKGDNPRDGYFMSKCLASARTVVTHKGRVKFFQGGEAEWRFAHEADPDTEEKKRRGFAAWSSTLGDPVAMATLHGDPYNPRVVNIGQAIDNTMTQWDLHPTPDVGGKRKRSIHEASKRRTRTAAVRRFGQ